MIDESNSQGPLIGNRYQIEKLIGAGGLAVIYKAWDTSLERTIAIKLLRQKYSRNNEFSSIFQQEAKMVAMLNHKNIVTIYDIGFDNNRIYMALEYVPGIDFNRYLKKRTSINLREVLGYMLQACNGVKHAHSFGVIHCDLKPANILLSPAGQVKITDFGLAKIIQSMTLNEGDHLWCSPLYTSPEQSAGKSSSESTDIYSLGVVLYEMTTGQLPFYAEDVNELIRMHRKDSPLNPRAINPEISEELERIILKALEKNPKNRFNSVSQLHDSLFTVRQHLTMRSISPTLITSSTQNEQATAPKAFLGRPDKKRIHLRGNLSFDFLTISIALLAAIAVAGLIPFWIYIYFNIPGK